jgi:hypothetical protein
MAFRVISSALSFCFLISRNKASFWAIWCLTQGSSCATAGFILEIAVNASRALNVTTRLISLFIGTSFAALGSSRKSYCGGMGLSPCLPLA